MPIVQIRILDTEDIVLARQKLLRITYYDQYESPHIVRIDSYVTPTARKKIYVGQTFNTLQEFEAFLHQK